jgi:hypothetical protein
MTLVQSNSERDILFSMLNLDICFVADSPIELQIKQAMKTSTTIQNIKNVPSLFQIAAHIEDVVPTTASKATLSLNQKPFADLMLHPEKLEAVLKTAKNEGRANITQKTRVRHAMPRNSSGRGTKKSSSHSFAELKRTEFHLKAPFAGSVKLAADFTDWEKFPLDLIKSDDGVWSMVVPLLPGRYAYRFIVDGQWYDDPQAALSEPNLFGTNNAVMNVF